MAPILADACVDRGARCHFVVASEAKSGGCLFTIGMRDFDKCTRIRRAEMVNAATLFGGKVEFLGLHDLFYSFNEAGKARTIDEWSKASGGRDALVSRFEKIIRKQRPQMLFTFDPRHGSSCHASHMSTAQLVIEAVRRIPKSERPAVWLEQTDEIEERSPENEKIISGIGFVGWPDTVADTLWYDANHKLKNGKSAYDFALLARRSHPSQFPDEISGKKVSTASPEAREVPLARLPTSISGNYCTDLALRRPTMDIPENRERLRKLLASPE